MVGGRGCCFKIIDMECFMVHNLVSVHHKSINLGQVTNLILSCLVVVSVYWLVEIWNWPHSLLNSEVAHLFVSWHRVLSRVVLKAVLEPCTEPKIWLLSVCIIWSNQSLYITSLLEGNATSLCCSCHSTDSIFIWTPSPPSDIFWNSSFSLWFPKFENFGFVRDLPSRLEFPVPS